MDAPLFIDVGIDMSPRVGFFKACYEDIPPQPDD